MTRLTTIFLACQTPKLYTLKIDLRGDPTSFGTLNYFNTYFLKKLAETHYGKSPILFNDFYLKSNIF